MLKDRLRKFFYISIFSLAASLVFLSVTNRNFNQVQPGATSSQLKSDAHNVSSTSSTTNVGLLPSIPVRVEPSYLINEPDVCRLEYPNLSILIYVHTDPSHFVYRTVIRNTWGNKKLYGRLKMITMFIVGRVKNSDVEATIKWESQHYHDIIQGDFIDSYRNLTYKALTSHHWIINFCPNVKFVVKVDDDVFINVFSLSRTIKKIMLQPGNYSKNIFCTLKIKTKVERSKASKWYVSNETYKDNIYPDYCLGYGYFMPTEIVDKLYSVSLNSTFFWIDDVYMTGILAKLGNITLKDSRFYFVFSPGEFHQRLLYGDAIFGHMSGYNQIENREKFWKGVEDVEFNSV